MDSLFKKCSICFVYIWLMSVFILRSINFSILFFFSLHVLNNPGIHELFLSKTSTCSKSLKSWSGSDETLKNQILLFSCPPLQGSAPDGLVSILKRRRASLDGLPPPSSAETKQNSKRKVRFSEPEDGIEQGTVKLISVSIWIREQLKLLKRIMTDHQTAAGYETCAYTQLSQCSETWKQHLSCFFL